MFQCFNVPMCFSFYRVARVSCPLVHWSIGPSVHWSLGPLVHGSMGPLVHWSIGPLVHWSVGPLVRWSVGPLVHKTSALLGRCLALTLLHQLITPSVASGTADHVQSLDDLFIAAPAHRQQLGSHVSGLVLKQNKVPLRSSP